MATTNMIKAGTMKAQPLLYIKNNIQRLRERGGEKERERGGGGGRKREREEEKGVDEYIYIITSVTMVCEVQPKKLV